MPNAITKMAAVAWISRVQVNKAVNSAKGSRTIAIAAKWPTASGPMARNTPVARRSITPADIANGQPMPGLTP